MRKKMEILPILRIGIEHFLVAFLPPIVLGLIYHWGNMRIERLEFLLNAMITSTTTCSGFILTSVSILIGLSNTPLMKKINSTRASKELQYRYKENLLVGLALIIVSVLIGTNTEDKVIPAIVFYSYVWIIGAYLISTVTVCWYLLSIIDLAPKSEISSLIFQADSCSHTIQCVQCLVYSSCTMRAHHSFDFNCFFHG